MMGTRYVGAGVLASAVGMDKHFMKLVLSASGLPVGPFVAITPAEWARDQVACLEAVAALHLPGLREAGPRRFEPGHQQGGRRRPISAAAIDLAQQLRPQDHRRAGLRRRPRTGVRRARPISGGGPPLASELAEIRVHTASGFYDFDAKYLPEEQVDLDVPADVDADLADEVEQLAVRDLRGHRLRGSGPGRRLRDPRRPGRGQRDQHHARLHRALDVPADVGRERHGLPGTGRPPDHAWPCSAPSACAEPPLARSRLQAGLLDAGRGR